MESRETQNEDVLRGRGWIATPSAVPQIASNQKIEKCELRWNQQLQKIKTAHEPCATVLLRAGSLGFCPAMVRDNFRKEETREKLGIFVQHMRVFGPWKGREATKEGGLKILLCEFLQLAVGFLAAKCVGGNRHDGRLAAVYVYFTIASDMTPCHQIRAQGPGFSGYAHRAIE
jgi:hypothetical protein